MTVFLVSKFQLRPEALLRQVSRAWFGEGMMCFCCQNVHCICILWLQWLGLTLVEHGSLYIFTTGTIGTVLSILLVMAGPPPPTCHVTGAGES
jgi:hypothetical protein